MQKIEMLVGKWRRISQDALVYLQLLLGDVSSMEHGQPRKIKLPELALSLKFDMSSLGIYDKDEDLFQ